MNLENCDNAHNRQIPREKLIQKMAINLAVTIIVFWGIWLRTYKISQNNCTVLSHLCRSMGYMNRLQNISFLHLHIPRYSFLRVLIFAVTNFRGYYFSRFWSQLRKLIPAKNAQFDQPRKLIPAKFNFSKLFLREINAKIITIKKLVIYVKYKGLLTY